MSTGWALLDPVQAKQILDAMPALAEIIRVHGRVDDAELSSRFPFLPAPLHDHLAAMSWVRDRAVVLSCEGYGSAREAAEPEKTAAKAAAKVKALAARAVSVEFIQWGEHCQFLPKHVAEAQCKLRHIAFKAGDKKDALMEKWKQFDEKNEQLGLSFSKVASSGNSLGALAAQQRQSPRRGGGGAAGGGVGGAASPRGGGGVPAISAALPAPSDGDVEKAIANFVAFGGSNFLGAAPAHARVPHSAAGAARSAAASPQKRPRSSS